ncbi:MAG: hypothetical protein WD036_05825 [Bauldia sp.]
MKLDVPAQRSDAAADFRDAVNRKSADVSRVDPDAANTSGVEPIEFTVRCARVDDSNAT